MFDLAYPLEDTIEIDGNTYTLDLSFDNVLRLVYMLNDPQLHDIEQIEIGLQMLLGVRLEYAIEEKEEIFFKIFNEVIRRGEEKQIETDIEGNPMPQNNKEKAKYSIKEDAEYIYASFMQAYNIDLFQSQGKLHWYKFQALLDGLPGDTKFKEVIEIRTMELPKGKGSDKHRKDIEKLKDYYKLKGTEPI